MPYRRLPNTDNARIKSLKAAYAKGKELPPFKLAFSQKTFGRVQAFMPSFEKYLILYKQGFSNQVEKSKDYTRELRKAKMYISHFIQVMNMSIARGDMPASTRTFFGMPENSKRIPLLNTESEVIQWGERLIQGETDRMRQGLNPISNPTIAVVRVKFEKFMDAYKFQKTLQKSTVRNLGQLTDMRNEADEIIVNVWNEVEQFYRDLNEPERRKEAEEYGLVYVFRKNELTGNENSFNPQMSLEF